MLKIPDFGIHSEKPRAGLIRRQWHCPQKSKHPSQRQPVLYRPSVFRPQYDIPISVFQFTLYGTVGYPLRAHQWTWKRKMKRRRVYKQHSKSWEWMQQGKWATKRQCNLLGVYYIFVFAFYYFTFQKEKVIWWKVLCSLWTASLQMKYSHYNCLICKAVLHYTVILTNIQLKSLSDCMETWKDSPKAVKPLLTIVVVITWCDTEFICLFLCLQPHYKPLCSAQNYAWKASGQQHQHLRVCQGAQSHWEGQAKYEFWVFLISGDFVE